MKPNYDKDARIPIRSYVTAYDSRYPDYHGGDTNTSGYASFAGGRNQRIGYDNPLHRVQISSGLNASTPYYKCWIVGNPGTVVSSGENSGKYTGYVTRGFCRLQTIAGASTAFIDDYDSLVSDIALIKFKRKLEDASEAMNLVVPIAELKDLRHLVKTMADYTAGTIMTVNLAIDNALTKIHRLEASTLKRRGSWRRKRRKLHIADLQRTVAGLWLTWSFGIKPMLSEAEKVAVSLAAYSVREDKYVRISAQASLPHLHSADQTGISAHMHCNMTAHTETRVKATVRLVGGFSLNLRALDYTMATQLGLTKANILPALWELLPFSWLADYFGTIGAVFEDYIEVPPGTLVYLDKIERKEFEQTITYSPNWGGDAEIKSWSSTPARLSFGSYKRTPLDVLPHRALRFKTVDEIGKHAVTKVLNLAAVLAGRGNILSLFGHL